MVYLWGLSVGVWLLCGESWGLGDDGDYFISVWSDNGLDKVGCLSTCHWLR